MTRDTRNTIVYGIAIALSYGGAHFWWYRILSGRLGDPPASHPHYMIICLFFQAMILLLPGAVAGFGYLLPRRRGELLLRTLLSLALSLLILSKERWGQHETTLFLTPALLGLGLAASMRFLVRPHGLSTSKRVPCGIAVALLGQVVLFSAMGFQYRHLWIASPVWEKYPFWMWLDRAAWGLAAVGLGQWLILGPALALLGRRAPDFARGIAAGAGIVTTLAIGPLAYQAIAEIAR